MTNNDRIRMAVILTCFNRRAATMACLDRVHAQSDLENIDIKIFLTDDGSTDGTADAVAEAFPDVKVLHGDGNLFWNGGMYRAWEEAAREDFDYYVWLNDDTELFPNAIRNLLDLEQELNRTGGGPAIVGGAFQEPDTGKLAYGGRNRPVKWRPISFVYAPYSDEPQECDSMNGNFVLISRDIFRRVGNMDPNFTHGFGDSDYGLRARMEGCRVWIAGGYQGTCRRNAQTGSMYDRSMTLSQRWQQMMGPKGWPPKDAMIYTRRHGGVAWILFFIWPYARIVCSSLYQTILRFRPGSLQSVN